MTIEVKQNLVSSSKYNVKCPYSMDAEFITYHNTYNDATAENEVAYMIRNNNSVSFHFAVDHREVVQGIPTNRNAWHCGDGGKGNGNRRSIGVEVCYSKSGGEKYKQAEKLASKFIAQLLHERNWGVDRVKRHQQFSGKFCPHRILSEGRWNQVVAEIQKELNALKGGKQTSVKPAPITSKGYLEKGDKGTAVKELQTLLEKAGFEVGAIDGIFGNATDKAVRSFQAKYKLTIDGLAGNSTMQVLEAVTAPPKPTPKSVEDSADGKLVRSEKGSNVKILNDMLRALGHTRKTDDLFDQYTEAALIYFQKAHGLKPDGIYTTEVGKVMKEAIKAKSEKEYTYFVQIGAFSDVDNAESLAKQAEKDGFQTIIKKEEK